MALIDDTRLEGFFPLQMIESLEAEIGYWNGQRWFFVGTEDTVDENEILKIGRRIDVDGLIMQGGFWS